MKEGGKEARKEERRRKGGKERRTMTKPSSMLPFGSFDNIATGDGGI